MKNNKFLIILCAIGFVSLVGCNGAKTDAKKQDVEKGKIVSVAEANKEVMSDYVSYNGTIEPNKRNNITSASPIRIDKIHIEVGDKVKKGDVIAEMDKSQLVQQALQVENLATDLARLEELYKEGGVALQQLDQMRTQYDVAKKALNYLAENATLRSPISGVVTGRYYDNGDMPTSATAPGIATVMQIDVVKVRVNVSEEYFPRVKEGMEVEIIADSYPDKIFDGKITLIFPLIDAATHSFTVEISIPNKNLELRPGMYSHVNLKFGTKELIVLQDMAVQKQIGSNEKYVFVVEEGVAKRRTIKTGRTYNDKVEVIEGIALGDKIVVKGAGRLLEGDKVELAKE